MDYNEDSGGVSFKDRHPDWRDDKLVKDFLVWSSECFGA